MNDLRHSRDQQGIALIVVLGVVSLMVVLAGMLITASKVAAITSKVNVDRSRAKYAAESATAFSHWMVMNYNFNNPNRGVLAEEEGEETWWADGRDHVLEMVDGINAKVNIYDVNRGIDIRQLRNERSRYLHQYAGDDEDLRDALEEFFAVFNDYTDRDNRNKSHPDFGMENEDYESEYGLENFPRNNMMEFREEMYWIKNVEALVPGLRNLKLSTALPDDLFRLIAPKGVRDPGSKNYSFWSAPMHWLDANSTETFSASEREIIQECRAQGFVDEATIQECLQFDLHAKLRAVRGLSFNPNNAVVFTIDVTAGYPNSEISRRMVSTMNLSKSGIPNATTRSDVGNVPILTWWQKIFY